MHLPHSAFVLSSMTAADPTVPAAALDLDDLLQSDTAVLVVRHPLTGAPSGTSIIIAGPEHVTRKALVFARMRAARKDFEKNGAITITDPVDDEADETDLLARCTLGWTNMQAGGVPIEHSVDAARQLYADPRRRWLRNQVKVGLDQLELFIAGSAPV